MPHTTETASELIRYPATRIVDLLKSRQLSPVELLDALEQRIGEVDVDVNALPTLCFDRAHQWLSEISPDFLVNTVLAGMPVAIKDLMDVEGVLNTRGSLAYRDNVSSSSDILVTHIEKSGGVVYAKSNTPEFGTGANTVNYLFGATRNPWDTSKSAAGSSGGAAAALASGTAWLAHGSDMGGSLRNPASFCGVVGMRPTPGRISTTRTESVFDTLSTDGPMARNVADLALLLDAMTGHEPGDPLSFPAPTASFRESVKAPKIPGKIAWSVDLGITPVDPRVRKVFEDAVSRIGESGVEMVEIHPDFTGLNDTFHVLRAQSYATARPLLETHGDQLNPNVRWNIEEGLRLTTADIIRAEEERLRIVSAAQQFFCEYPLIITPATVVPAYPVEEDHVTSCDGHVFDNYYQWLSIAYAFTVSLSPAISIPCGFTDEGLPIGLQIAGPSQSEASILQAAAAMEDILMPTPITPINPVPGDGATVR